MRNSPFVTPFFTIFVACFGVLLPAAVRAADVAVFAPETSNLSPQDANAVGELIAQAYAMVSRQNVLSPASSQPALVQTRAYEAAAAQLAVKEFIRMSAVAAGRRIVIIAGRYQADGRVLQQVRQIVESIEDVALASDSVARALFTGTAQSAMPPPAGAAQAAPAPFAPPPRKKDQMVYGLKSGVHMPLARNASYYSAVSLQFNGRLQLPRFFLEFGVGFLLPTVMRNAPYVSCTWDVTTMTNVCPQTTSDRGHVGGITAEIGASYYLTDSDVAPYVGGGIIPRAILAGLDGNNGEGNERDIASMSGYVQVGLTFPRHQTTRFFVDLRVAQALLEQHLENGDTVWPSEPTLHAGIGW